MSEIEKLIAAHSRALSDLEAICVEQDRLEQEEIVTRQCAVDSLLSVDVGAGCFYGSDESDLTQQIKLAYDDAAISILWMRRHDKPAYEQAIDRLEDLRFKNLSFVNTAFKAWQQDRRGIAKKEARLQAQLDKAGRAETAAAVTLFIHPAADATEEAMRAKYVRETSIFNSQDHYGAALMQALFGVAEEQPASAPALELTIAASGAIHGGVA